MVEMTVAAEALDWSEAEVRDTAAAFAALLP
jgi:hypothetical protein